MDDRISTVLQEDLLVLLCFDPNRSNIIRNCVDIGLFEGVYKEIASRVYDYVDRYKAPPAEMLPSIFDDILEGDNKRKALLFNQVFTNLFETKDSVNAEYTMDRISEFVRVQELKLGIMESFEVLQNNSEDAADRVEEIINAHTKKRLEVFDSGIFLGDSKRGLEFLEEEPEAFHMGIPELDSRQLGPSPGQLHLLIGVYNKGKSWHLINIGKRALLSRKKVCHISLEMSEKEVIQRYYQAIFGLAKRKESSELTRFQLDELDHLCGLEPQTFIPKLFMTDPEVREALVEKVDKLSNKLNRVVVKRFPTGQLTVRQLEAYLENLEATQGFRPDIILLDYIDLMTIDPNNYRTSLGRLFVDIRGLAVKRHIAVSSVTQSNREGDKSKKVRGSNVAEDWSKMATADDVLTLNQTDEEEKRGLARIYVDKARNDKKGFTVLISQNYNTGQFVLDSALMTDSYWDILNGKDI